MFTQPIQNSTALYGTPGGIFGLLVFLYATMWSLLIGAELSSVLIRWAQANRCLARHLDQREPLEQVPPGIIDAGL